MIATIFKCLENTHVHLVTVDDVVLHPHSPDEAD